MIVNFSLWNSSAFGALGSMTLSRIPGTGGAADTAINLRRPDEPDAQPRCRSGGQVQSGLPGIPLFEFTLAVIPGDRPALYYVLSERGRLAGETVVRRRRRPAEARHRLTRLVSRTRRPGGAAGSSAAPPAHTTGGRRNDRRVGRHPARRAA